MKTILLTGASGFVGSYFREKYAGSYNIRTFSFLRDNLEALHVKGVDVVFHLSALVHQMGGASDVSYTEMTTCKSEDALGKKVYLVRVPFFESFLKLLKPSFHKRLYGSLEVDNTQTMKSLFGEAKASLPKSGETEMLLPFSVVGGIRLMLDITAIDNKNRYEGVSKKL